jgi:hypothetical protein
MVPPAEASWDPKLLDGVGASPAALTPSLISFISQRPHFSVRLNSATTLRRRHHEQAWPNGIFGDGVVLCSDHDCLRFQFQTPQLTLSSLTIAPSNGEIYVSASLASGVRSAARRGAGESAARPAVLPPPVTAICGKLQYTATAHFTNGNSTQVGIAVTWSSSNTSVASIDTTGLATGVGVGTTNIGATSMGVAATSQPLAVDQLNSISVSPATSTTAPRGSQKFLATGNFTLSTGSPGIFDVSSQATWSSSDTNVATIDQTGNATAKATGVTTITATSCDGGTVGQAVLNVGQPATTTLVVTPTVISIATGTTTLFTAMEKLGNTIQPPQNVESRCGAVV